MARIKKIQGYKGQSLESCLEHFSIFKQAQGVSERTIKDYEWHIKHFAKEFPECWGDNKLLQKAILQYFANGNKLAPATHNIRRKYLNCFLNWAVLEGIISVNPIESIPQRREEPRIRNIDEQKLQALLNAPDKSTYSGLRDYVLLCLSIDTGIRPKEALSLYPANFNLRSLEVNIPASVAKTRISRTLPITPLTSEGVRKLISVRPESWGTAPLFATAEGKPMSTSAWTHRLENCYGKKLGFKISSYDLRHAFALLFLRNGGHAFALQRTMGHTDLTITKRYVNLSQDDLRSQHAFASPLNGLIPKSKRVRKI